MSSFNLAKKLQPAKKAWKSFTNTIQFKLHKLNISKSIKTTMYRLIAFCPLRPLLPRKLRPRPRPHRSSNYHHHHHLFAAIYVDELFPEPASTHLRSLTEPNKAKEMVASRSGVTKATDVATTNLLPQFRGVDERAEEFISKFHQDMKLQREQSILDFQEMLARSA